MSLSCAAIDPREWPRRRINMVLYSCHFRVSERVWVCPPVTPNNDNNNNNKTWSKQKPTKLRSSVWERETNSVWVQSLIDNEKDHDNDNDDDDDDDDNVIVGWGGGWYQFTFVVVWQQQLYQEQWPGTKPTFEPNSFLSWHNQTEASETNRSHNDDLLLLSWLLLLLLLLCAFPSQQNTTPLSFSKGYEVFRDMCVCGCFVCV